MRKNNGTSENPKPFKVKNPTKIIMLGDPDSVANLNKLFASGSTPPEFQDIFPKQGIYVPTRKNYADRELSQRLSAQHCEFPAKVTTGVFIPPNVSTTHETKHNSDNKTRHQPAVDKPSDAGGLHHSQLAGFFSSNKADKTSSPANKRGKNKNKSASPFRNTQLAGFFSRKEGKETNTTNQTSSRSSFKAK